MKKNISIDISYIVYMISIIVMIVSVIAYNLSYNDVWLIVIIISMSGIVISYARGCIITSKGNIGE